MGERGWLILRGEDMACFRNDSDGFVGNVIGLYTTLEGVRGLVLQQIGTRVVHTYQVGAVSPVGPEPRVAKARVAVLENVEAPPLVESS
jgi:hypothetical protein